VLMTKFGKAKKPDHLVSSSGLFGFGRFLGQEQAMSYTRRFEDPRCFEVWKRTKRDHGAKMEEIQARS
jgi:hypothetical protein